MLVVARPLTNSGLFLNIIRFIAQKTTKPEQNKIDTYISVLLGKKKAKINENCDKCRSIRIKTGLCISLLLDKLAKIKGNAEKADAHLFL